MNSRIFRRARFRPGFRFASMQIPESWSLYFALPQRRHLRIFQLGVCDWVVRFVGRGIGRLVKLWMERLVKRWIGRFIRRRILRLLSCLNCGFRDINRWAFSPWETELARRLNLGSLGRFGVCIFYQGADWRMTAYLTARHRIL
jgi:hypothetical protein